MKRIGLAWGLLACAAFGQSGVEPPAIGLVRDEAGAVRPVLGVRGNLLIGDPIAHDAESAVLWKGQPIVKTPTELLIGGGRYPAPPGPALFAFTDQAAYILCDGQLLRWAHGALNPVPPGSPETGGLRFEEGLGVERMSEDWVHQWDGETHFAVRIADGVREVYQLPWNPAELTATAATTTPQLQLLVVEGSVERVSGPVEDFGATATGEFVDKRFRIRNTGATTTQLLTLNVVGDGFRLQGEPTTPFFLAAGFSVDFRVRFFTTAFGSSYSATLSVNGAITTLTAAATATARLRLEDTGELRVWDTTLTVNFGQVERGSTATRRFQLDNPQSIPVTVTEIAVSGNGYGLPRAIGLPRRLLPGESLPFDVGFSPLTSGLLNGTLTVDQRRFPLTAAGTEPGLPRPSVVLSQQALESGQQARVSVRFAAPSRGNGTGRLRIEFRPSTPGQEDAGLMFVSTSSRAITFEIREGDTEARFGSQPEAVFQTGTTAGALTMIVESGGFTDQAAAAIAPGKIVIDTARGTRQLSSVDTQISGFDNTRSAGSLNFTFYDQSGAMIGSGAIHADAAAQFARYFEGSTLGGMFLLNARFPVSGDPAAIAAVDVELTNSVGLTRAARIAF